MSDIFSRSEMLIGGDAQRLLAGLHAAVFGLGGVGSYAAEALARAGIGTLTLIDNDIICESNINRQLYALRSTLGRKKTEVARERILDINPHCTVYTIDRFYLPENADGFFERRFDIIADAVDTVSAKLDLAVRAKKMNISIVSCMGTGNKLDPSLFRVSDIYETEVCPLCRVMRRELRARDVDSLRVVWSPEPPLTPLVQATDSSKRSAPGSISFVPPVAGLLMAGELIRTALDK